ncbi:MAG: peptidylprolyl isomerase [Thermodesulfobacteriota bacterium]
MRYIFFLFIIFSLTALLSCKGRERAQVENDVVAWVNGKTITYADFIDIWEENTTGEILRGEEVENMKKSFLDHLIEERLILEEGERLGIDVKNMEIEERIRSIKGDFTDEEFRVKVLGKDKSMDRWREQIEKQILTDKIIDKVVSSYSVVTEEEALAYYNSHLEEFNRPEEFRALQIVVRSEEEAQKLLARINKGEDFRELAGRYSLSPDRKKGGDLGFFAKGEMPEEFEEAIFSLSKGKVSHVVKSRYGYHLFKLMERRKGRVLGFPEVKERVIFRLGLERKEKVFTKWMENLKNNSEIKTDTKLLKDII